MAKRKSTIVDAAVQRLDDQIASARTEVDTAKAKLAGLEHAKTVLLAERDASRTTK
jgi:hypothetical protein